MVDTQPTRHLRNKRAVLARLSALAASASAGTANAASAAYQADAAWRGPHPLNAREGRDAIVSEIWLPLHRAMPDMERRDLILVGGEHRGRDFIAAMGHYCGTFRRDWLGIPASGDIVFLRYGEVHEVRDGLIVQSSCIWDLLDLMRQAGVWPISKSLGAEIRWPGPITGDGLALDDSDPDISAASLAQTLAMQATLGAYDDEAEEGREGLLNMPQRRHWHPRMMWYGPAGIGTARGLEGFVDVHQLPFRRAFPNRKGGGQWDDIPEAKAELGGGHFIRIGDGPYSVTGGWPSVYARHSGAGFLGLPPTGRTVSMRVMDFYLHGGGLIRENWVPIDIIDLLGQIGIDVMERMRMLIRRDQTGLPSD